MPPRLQRFIATLLLSMPIGGLALDLEPRLWSHLPIQTNVIGTAYAYTEADIAFDPVLKLENVDMALHTWAVKGIRSFSLFNKTARIALTQGVQKADWQGLLDGRPASTKREGLSDTVARVAINFIGSPALNGADFARYRSRGGGGAPAGIGLAIRLPTGDYDSGKLLNLGGNRLVLRPQIGLSHQRGKWLAEVTAEAAHFSDNDEFFNGNTLEQAPLYIVHSHLIYSLKPGLWFGLSAGYDYGGETKINGVAKK